MYCIAASRCVTTIGVTTKQLGAVSYACIYIAIMATIAWRGVASVGLADDGRRILRDKGREGLVCLELYSYTYDRRPARRGGHDPRAAGAAAIKERARH